MNIYVSNIAFSMTEEQLREVFSQFGAVDSVKIITDRRTGRSRGYGFVEMNDTEAQGAIDELDGKEVIGRVLKVNKAHEREEKPAE